MFALDKERIKKILISEFGYDPNAADLYLANYPSLDDIFKDPVLAWLEDRRILETNIDGVSIPKVMQAHSCNFLTAVSTINDLFTRQFTPDQKDVLRRYLVTPPIRA